jgi:hypothetical protein
MFGRDDEEEKVPEGPYGTGTMEPSGDLPLLVTHVMHKGFMVGTAVGIIASPFGLVARHWARKRWPPGTVRGVAVEKKKKKKKKNKKKKKKLPILHCSFTPVLSNRILFRYLHLDNCHFPFDLLYRPSLVAPTKN